MLIDLLSPSNQVSFNIQVAQTFGLHAAIYLSELIAINEKAIRKNKIEKVGRLEYFKIDRKYILDRTTLSLKEQQNLDEDLSKIKIIHINKEDSNKINLDIDALATLLGTDIDKSILNDLSKITKKKSKDELREEKIESQRKSAQKAVVTTNPELRTAFYRWIDSVINRYNTISKSTVIVNEKLLNDFCNHDLDLALEIVNNTSIAGYNSMKYAIDTYLDKHPSKKEEKVKIKQIELSNEVF